jgi:hypothetical protein
MMTNSEARKAREAASTAHRDERRREVARDALAAVYSGAGFPEADAFLDALDDLGGWPA